MASPKRISLSCSCVIGVALSLGVPLQAFSQDIAPSEASRKAFIEPLFYRGAKPSSDVSELPFSFGPENQSPLIRMAQADLAEVPSDDSGEIRDTVQGPVMPRPMIEDDPTSGSVDADAPSPDAPEIVAPLDLAAEPSEQAIPRQEDQVAEVPQDEPADPEVASYSGLKTADVTRANFSEKRFEAIAQAGVEAAGVSTDIELARVLLGGMFLNEASEAISQAGSREGLSAVDRSRITDIEEALSAIDPTIASSGSSSAPWSGIGASSGNPLWSTITSIRSGTPVPAARIREAAGSLSDHSWWIGGEVIPHLFTGAVRVGDTGLAGGILDAAEQDGSVGASEMSLLRGRLAQAMGDAEGAFDHYAEAMTYDDIPGVEARIAFSDLVMDRGVPGTFPRLREILTEGVASWRNDDYARRLMTRLAAVTEELGDTLGALHVMSRIAAEFPGTDEASLAETRMMVLLGTFAEKGRSEEIDIESYMKTIRDLGWRVSGGQQWVSARLVLADKLAEYEMHEAAAAEYASILSGLGSAQDIVPSVSETVAVKEARSRITLGQIGRARDLLSPSFSGTDDITMRERELLLAQISGLPDVIDIAENPAAVDEYWLINARNSFNSRNDIEAVRFYDNHLGTGKGLPREDASRYTLAKARTTDEDSMQGISGVVTGEGSEGIVSVGTSLSSDSVEMRPLSTQKASEILGLAAETLEAADRILGRNVVPDETEQPAPNLN